MVVGLAAVKSLNSRPGNFQEEIKLRSKFALRWKERPLRLLEHKTPFFQTFSFILHHHGICRQLTCLVLTLVTSSYNLSWVDLKLVNVTIYLPH